MKEKPQYLINKAEYNKRYDKEHACMVTAKLYDEELYQVWKSLPNKAEWLREKLREYEKENSNQ